MATVTKSGDGDDQVATVTAISWVGLSRFNSNHTQPLKGSERLFSLFKFARGFALSTCDRFFVPWHLLLKDQDPKKVDWSDYNPAN